MSKLESAWNNIKSLEELAGQPTMIHRLHPIAKLLTTMVFIIVTASFDKYAFITVLPMLLYPWVIMTLAELPVGLFLKRLLMVAPFVLCIGIFNPLFDTKPLIQIGIVTLSGGWLSFLSIIIRFILTVVAALILISTSGMNEIGSALLKLRVPKVFVLQLLFLYRYLSVLIEETIRVLRAHSVRSQNGKGLRFIVWGSLIGQLLFRTIDRAERIYQAMLCRGFSGSLTIRETTKIGLKDIFYVLGWSGYFVLIRFNNIPELIGSLWIGAGR